jgi:hypothetical protein
MIRLGHKLSEESSQPSRGSSPLINIYGIDMHWRISLYRKSVYIGALLDSLVHLLYPCSDS